MSFFGLAALIMVITAVFAFLNLKTLKLPTTIGVMLMALIFSVGLTILHSFGFYYDDLARSVLATLDFEETLMNGMLSFLLFAGALHVNLDRLKEQLLPVSLLATVGVLISTFFIGYITYLIVGSVVPDVEFIHCLLFGALISPTDPIAVLSLLKEAKAPIELETKIAGESLFNDGVGVVVFTLILGLIVGKSELSASGVGLLFLHEAVGGAFFGVAIGALAFWTMKSIDNYKVEVIITLALVMGGYSLAHYWHLSAPLAMVLAGLLIGNHGKKHAMSDVTEKHVVLFWELIDEILNLSLFVLIGLEIILISYNLDVLLYSFALIPVVLAGRFLGVLLPLTFLKQFSAVSKGVIPIMTWGGLRGGISVALALSLPQLPGRDFFIGITYSIVIFSVVVQGLSFRRVLGHYIKS